MAMRMGVGKRICESAFALPDVALGHRHRCVCYYFSIQW